MSVVAVNWPENAKADDDKLRLCEAALESLRRSHNTRAGDLSSLANGYRKRILDLQTALVRDTLLPLRETVITPGYAESKPEAPDPIHALLKAEGRAAWRSANVAALLGVDVEARSAPMELPPDPLQNFLTQYTELDAGGKIAVTATALTVTTMPNNADAYVYRDRGVGWITSPWRAYLDTQFTYGSVASSQYFGIFGVSQVVDDYWAWYVNAQKAIYNYWRTTASVPILILGSSNPYALDASVNLVLSTRYYLTTERTAQTAAQTTIYSDSARTVQVDLIAIAPPTAQNHRYCFGVISYNKSETQTASGDARNLDFSVIGKRRVCAI